MDNLKHYAQKLCSFPHRGTVTKDEKKAARMILGEFKKMGYEPQLQRFKTIKRDWILESVEYALFLISTLLILSGKTFSAIVFFILGIFVLIGLYSRVLYKVLALFYRTDSQNVWVEKLPVGETRQTVVVLGHYDTARANLGIKLLKPFAVKLGPKANELPPFFRGPFFISNLAVVLNLALFFLNSFPTIQMALGVAAALLLTMTILILLSLFFSPHVPGALDNASGAAVVMSLAKEFAKKNLRNTQLIFLTPGAEEISIHGVKFFVKKHKLDKERTFFINLDGVGGERLTFASGESDSFGFTRAYDPGFFFLVKKIKDEKFPKVKEFYMPVPSDCRTLIDTGYKQVAMVNSLDNDGFYDHYHQMTDTIDKLNFKTMALCQKFVAEVIREIDIANN